MGKGYPNKGIGSAFHHFGFKNLEFIPLQQIPLLSGANLYWLDAITDYIGQQR
jgi:hypothetical protein